MKHSYVSRLVWSHKSRQYVSVLPLLASLTTFTGRVVPYMRRRDMSTLPERDTLCCRSISLRLRGHIRPPQNPEHPIWSPPYAPALRLIVRHSAPLPFVRPYLLTFRARHHLATTTIPRDVLEPSPLSRVVLLGRFHFVLSLTAFLLLFAPFRLHLVFRGAPG